jgi:hypothetical protein
MNWYFHLFYPQHLPPPPSLFLSSAFRMIFRQLPRNSIGPQSHNTYCIMLYRTCWQSTVLPVYSYSPSPLFIKCPCVWLHATATRNYGCICASPVPVISISFLLFFLSSGCRVRLTQCSESFGVKDPVDCGRSWFQSLTSPCSLRASSVIWIQVIAIAHSHLGQTLLRISQKWQQNHITSRTANRQPEWITFASGPLYRLSLYTLKSTETAFS